MAGQRTVVPMELRFHSHRKPSVIRRILLIDSPYAIPRAGYAAGERAGPGAERNGLSSVYRAVGAEPEPFEERIGS